MNNKLVLLHDKDPWMLGEDIPNADLFFSTVWLSCFVNEFVNNTGRAYKKILCKYTGYHLWFYFGAKDSNLVGENIARRIVNELGYAQKINKNIILEANKLSAYIKTIPQVGLSKLSNKQLWNIYNKHYKIHTKYYTWCWIPVAADMFHNNLTGRVKNYLRSLNVTGDKINEYLIILTQPTNKSLIFIEQQKLLKIALEIEKDKNALRLFKERDEKEILNNLSPKLYKLILKHCNTYYYTKHLWVEGEYTMADYVKQLKEILLSGKLAKHILSDQIRDLTNNKLRKVKLLKQLNITGQWKIVLDAFGDFMVTKIYRRYAQILAVHHMSAILREIARRRFVTEKQVRFMRPSEVKDMILFNKFNNKELLERTNFCVYYAEREAEKVFSGKEANKIMQSVNTKVNIDTKELRGEIGCTGYAKGKVKIIIRASDMSKMEKGDVLVSIATDPDIVPAMKKAAAIVTEQGGVTSHAAIVSRELGIPCVIGTKIATKVLKDGDMVEVDANKGIVKKI